MEKFENKEYENPDIPNSIIENKKAKFTMKKKTFWIIAGIVIAILVVLVVWQTMQINAISSGANIARNAGSAAQSAASSSGMVGGC